MSGRAQGALPNAEQAEYWNSEPSRQWIAFQEALDQRFAPLTELLIERAQVARGACVLDVGCGTGATTLRLAGAVGAHGSVLALDISEPLLAVARRRIMDEGHANVRFMVGDAQTHRFERASYDLALSRFGVMFFEDPIQAFGNLKSALRSGARLTFVCWGPLEDNPWFALPLQVGIERLGPPEPRPARAPGPLALSEPDYVEAILGAAGFAEVRIERIATLLPGAADVREEAGLASRLGLLARLLRERGADAATRERMVEELAERLRPYLTTEGVRLPALLHLVSAAAPRGPSPTLRPRSRLPRQGAAAHRAAGSG
jgi:SAM-dependent methyltransferase